MTYIKSKSFHYPASNQGRIILSILIAVAICLMGFFYIFQANSAVSQGYEIRKIKENLEKLQVENQKLQIEAARLQFPANLEEIAQKLNMEEVDKVVYLKKSIDVATVQPNNSN